MVLSNSGDGNLREHPLLRTSAQVLSELLDKGAVISPELCTAAFEREIRLESMNLDELRQYELQLRFTRMADKFRVIGGGQRTAVVDRELIKRLEIGIPVHWVEVQKASVQIWGHRLNALQVPIVAGKPDLYKWELAYNDFIGYMEGVFEVDGFNSGDPAYTIL